MNMSKVHEPLVQKCQQIANNEIFDEKGVYERNFCNLQDNRFKVDNFLIPLLLSFEIKMKYLQQIAVVMHPNEH